MVQATETFALGGTQVTTVVEIDLNTVWLISGDFAGTIPSGQIGFINGNVNLTGDLIVEGMLTGIDTFTLEGNGFQLLVQDGGQFNLQGVEKSGWVPWGDTPVGWLTGDSLRVAGSTLGIFIPYVSTWGGSWATTTRPSNAPDVTLPDGTIVKPEVTNAARSIVLNNLSRIHFHDGAGAQTLRWLAIRNSGVTGVLAKYPLHFHLCGESVRGSLVEGVIVENGKNHAFVVHGSHGVTLRDCVAYNTFNDVYWWDPPIFSDENHTANNSNDVRYEHCLAMYARPTPGDDGLRLTGFAMGAGSGNVVIDSVACCIQGGKEAAGYTWPESANQNIGGNVWLFKRNVAHNNKSLGIFVWQNDSHPHLIEDFVGYRSGLAQIDHGAYDNIYHYKDVVLQGGAEAAFKLHAHGNIILENMVTAGSLRIMRQQSDATQFVVVKNCDLAAVSYMETGNSGSKASKIRYEDCGLVPANFNLAGIIIRTIIEITEGGVLTYRWANGVWG